MFSMAEKRRTVPKPAPEDPDNDILDRDEALQPDLSEAERNRKASGEARAARDRDNTYHGRKCKLAHLTGHLPQELWDAFLADAVQPRVKACSERTVIGSLLLGSSTCVEAAAAAHAVGKRLQGQEPASQLQPMPHLCSTPTQAPAQPGPARPTHYSTHYSPSCRGPASTTRPCRHCCTYRGSPSSLGLPPDSVKQLCTLGKKLSVKMLNEYCKAVGLYVPANTLRADLRYMDNMFASLAVKCVAECAGKPNFNLGDLLAAEAESIVWHWAARCPEDKATAQAWARDAESELEKAIKERDEAREPATQPHSGKLVTAFLRFGASDLVHSQMKAL
ncbi:hypothetical protein QJQ45_013657 [Haematococcus lacustris]|nr:hypothetical protein QJQ45_013657 [Haematococcus lacustris]